MSADPRTAFTREVTHLIQTGTEKSGVDSLRLYLNDSHLPEIQAELQGTLSADEDEAPLLLLDLIQRTSIYRAEQANLQPINGELREAEEGGYWQSPLSGDVLYSLVPETRPFAKRAKAPQQVEYIETAARRGTVADLRLLQLFLKKLNSKADDDVADAIAKTALPAYGQSVLPDLWPSLSADNRTFLAAHRIDMEATLGKLMEKSGKKSSDKSSQVMKAVETLLEDVFEEGAVVGPESLPILKLGLKYAPDGNFRRRIAETIASVGDAAKESLSDLVDAFERGGIARDHHLIRILVVLGKESEEVCEALIRALEDRDSTVRVLSAFNIGQLGEPALNALDALERTSIADSDPKVRDQATKTLNKLRARFEPAFPLDEGEAVESTV